MLNSSKQSVFDYDVASRLLKKTNQKGFGGSAVVASRFDYAYDAVGNRTSQQDGFGTHNFSYDDVYRLLGVDAPAESFSYDDVGNRLTSVDSGSNFGHVHNANNQLISMTKDGAPYANFSYDSNGNLLSKTVEGVTTTYTWDSENRLVGITTPADTIAYAYDPFGRRIEKSVGAAITRYVYDREDIVAEYDGAGLLQATYIHGPGIDEPLEMKRGGVNYFYQRDGLDSIVGLANAAGTVVRSYRYDSFGRIINETGSVENPYIYTGRERDTETGLYYYRARYYDSQLGRFISEDPIGFKGGNNFYGYVENNPLNFIDSFGLSRVVFDPIGGYIDVYPGDSPNVQGPPQRFPASNRSRNPGANPYQPSGYGSVPTGTFPTGSFVETGGGPNSEFGSGFVPIQLPTQPPYSGPRTGVGIHAGRANTGRGVNYGTLGCIRTNENALGAFRNDPVSTITVFP